MTVLVTGAAGFLGGHVTDLLAERGDRPRALIRPDERADRLNEAGAEVCRADIRDYAAVRAAMAGAEIVIHCAARTGPWGPKSEYEQTNVGGLETVVKAALDIGVRRLVHVSSITVHGNDLRGCADEGARLHAEQNPYSRSKLAAERLLQLMIRQNGAPVTIVRPGWIYGPGDNASFARLARMIQSGRMVTLGSGSNQLPLIYVRDAAAGVLAAAAADEHTVGRPYLLVSDERVTQRQYLAAIAAELGVPPPARRIPYRAALLLGAAAEGIGHLTRQEQPPPVMRYGLQLLGGDSRFDIARARRELGFVPQVKMADGVRASVEWYRAVRGLPARAGVLT